MLAVPIMTQSAPRANALATSTPERMPPAATSLTLPDMPMSSRARRAAGIAARVGTPVWSRSSSGDAPVPPSMPSTTTTSAPVLAAIAVSKYGRGAPLLTQVGDLDLHVVGAQEVRVPDGGALADAHRQRPDPGHPFGDLHAEQQSAGTRFGALPDGDLDAIG